MQKTMGIRTTLKDYFLTRFGLLRVLKIIIITIGPTYVFLFLINLALFKFGYSLPFIPLNIRELGVSMGFIDYTNHPQYRRWLKGYIHPIDRSEWIVVKNGGAYDPYGIHNPDPQTFSWPATDSLGFINDKPVEEADVLFIGDSFGLGAASGFEESIPVIFEDISDLKTYNVSNSGYGLPHYLEILRYFTEVNSNNAPLFQGKIVYILLFIGNDLYPDLDTFERRLADEQNLHIAHYLTLDSLQHIVSLGRQGIENTVQGMQGIESTHGWYPNYLTIPSYENALPFAFHPYNKRFLDATWFDGQRKSYIIAKLKEFKEDSEQTGVKVRFIILPTKLQVVAPYLQPKPPEDLKDFDKSYPAIVKMQDSITEFMVQQVRSMGFEVLNMEPIIKDRIVREQLFWPEDTHLTPAGNYVVAESIYSKFHSTSILEEHRAQ